MRTGAHKAHSIRRLGANALARAAVCGGTTDLVVLRAVRRCAHRRYASLPNVLAVGLGTKFKRGLRSSGMVCIQFFVSRKRRNLIPSHRLPRFVYGRFRDGRIDYRRKIPTDVIAVGSVRAACRAGSPVAAGGGRGLITIVFRNKIGRSNVYYLVTCSHVAGDIRRSPPAYPEVRLGNSNAGRFARTVANSTASSGELEFDIALARIDRVGLPLEELRVRDTTTVLDSFLPARSIQPGLGVDVMLSKTSTHATVDSLDVVADVEYGGDSVRVGHLFGLNACADPGDSGGLVYRGTAAAGMVAAVSPAGWIWFHALEPATAFLNRISPVRISVFNPQPQRQ